MTTNSIALIKHYESLHDGDLSTIGAQPKMDPEGIWTVGWGHKIIDPVNHQPLVGINYKGRALQLYPVLTDQQADQLLMQDLSIYEAEVARAVRVALTPERIGALVSFTYNCGIGGLLTSSVLRYTNTYDYSRAADALLLWNKGVNARGQIIVLPGLTARRQSERELYLTGNLKFFN